jgi:hypothetical protein
LLLTKAQDKAELSARNQHEPPVDREDQDWEKVEKNVVKSAPNGLAVDDDWSGLVGFFHPFWCVLKFIVEISTDNILAMPEVEENEFFGQQYEQRKIDGQTLYV